jgi:hypothetical protein
MTQRVAVAVPGLFPTADAPTLGAIEVRFLEHVLEQRRPRSFFTHRAYDARSSRGGVQ